MPSLNVSSSIPAPVAKFLQKFFELSEDESKPDEYVQSFVSSGVEFRFGPMKTITTPEEILAWRNEKWEPTAGRFHNIHDVFAHPDNKDQYMLHGLSEYKLKNGIEGAVRVSAWIVFDDVKAEQLKLKKYTVWMTPDAK